MTSQATPLPYGPETLLALAKPVVGRVREAEIIIAALMSGRHLLLEGPPGTGKSTLLRAIAETTDHSMVFVEGNAELTPARLVGHFDPAQVLESGYDKSIWIDGPLTTAMREGTLLYLEEINRIPEETLNVLVTVMSEGELSVPRLGRIEAADSFRIVAAMNPFDAVGTARISGAIYDRVCRVAVDYQSEADEIQIAARWSDLPPAYVASVVSVVRDSRSHPEVRVGSSVRGAIDQLVMVAELARLRGVDPSDYTSGLDSALAALSGRIRLHESSTATPEHVVEQLWSSHFTPPPSDDEAANEPDNDQPSPPANSNPSGKA